MKTSTTSNDSPPSFSDICKVLQFLNGQARTLIARRLTPLEWNRLFLSLRFETIDLRLALELNCRWHSHLPRLDRRVAAWLCYGAIFDHCYCAAAVWSLPVARLLPQDGSCLELRRFALATGTPKNSASRMLGWMVRDLRHRKPAVLRLVSYQDSAVHRGTIYKAAGWTPVATSGGGNWNHPGRRRAANRIPTKVRWELFLSP